MGILGAGRRPHDCRRGTVRARLSATAVLRSMRLLLRRLAPRAAHADKVSSRMRAFRVGRRLRTSGGVFAILLSRWVRAGAGSCFLPTGTWQPPLARGLV